MTVNTNIFFRVTNLHIFRIKILSTLRDAVRISDSSLHWKLGGPAAMQPPTATLASLWLDMCHAAAHQSPGKVRRLLKRLCHDQKDSRSGHDPQTHERAIVPVRVPDGKRGGR